MTWYVYDGSFQCRECSEERLSVRKHLSRNLKKARDIQGRVQVEAAKPQHAGHVQTVDGDVERRGPEVEDEPPPLSRGWMGQRWGLVLIVNVIGSH